MSTSRTLQYSKAFPPKKDQDGKYLCRWCDKVLTGRATSFCSTACTDEALIRCWPSHARKLVFKRDKGVCGACGLDTVKAETIIKAHAKEVHGPMVPCWGNNMRQMRGSEAVEMFLNLKRGNRRTLWEANHILPVIEGGGACGLDNFETLCLWCHRDHTKELRARMRQAKKVSR